MTGISGNIGIIGGTFDPPHIGHLILAETAADVLSLDRVLFAPAADPPHKQHHKQQGAMTPAPQRVAMVERAIAENPRFALSRVDLDREGPHYTVDMLRLLCEESPTAQLYFLMGGDSLADFPKWRDPEGILALARLAVIRRPGDAVSFEALRAVIPQIEERAVIMDAPLMSLSGYSVRALIAAGRSVRYQIPDPVAAYIRDMGLYR